MACSSEVVFTSSKHLIMESTINHVLREVLHVWWGLVNVKVTKGEVVLSGYVQSAKKKEELLLAVQAIADALHVKDELIVVSNLS